MEARTPARRQIPRRPFGPAGSDASSGATRLLAAVRPTPSPALTPVPGESPHAGQLDRRPDGRRVPRVVVLVPAYNEASTIGPTIESVLAQTRPADEVLVIPNGCTDDTSAIARRYPVSVLELPRLEHRKSEALTLGWSSYASGADIVITLDADTLLPDHAFADWVAEFEAEPALAGSCAKFTVVGDSVLARIQKAEYGSSIDDALRTGSVRVLPGAGCAFRGSALLEVARREDRAGPWAYHSATEDFELTYRLRELGHATRMSPTVRAYTDSMRDLRSLWHQRLKWQVGTIEDLQAFGLNRLTWRDWGTQLAGFGVVALKLLWLVLMTAALVLGVLQLAWFWLVVPPALSIAIDVKRALRLPHRDRRDLILAASYFPSELFMLLRVGWFLRAWSDVSVSKITGIRTDRWAAQARAEGIA